MLEMYVQYMVLGRTTKIKVFFTAYSELVNSDVNRFVDTVPAGLTPYSLNN